MAAEAQRSAPPKKGPPAISQVPTQSSAAPAPVQQPVSVTVVNQPATPTQPAASVFWSPQVFQGIITAIGTILATLILIRVAQRFQVQEGSSRAEPSLNIDVSARSIRPQRDVAISGDTLILETRIDIKNNSRRACCIPAAYVSARVFSAGEEYTAETDFYGLAECGKLSESRNVVRPKGTVIQVAPDEIERFVRWDTLDRDFVNRFPVIVLNVEAFGAELKDLGEWHYIKPWWAKFATLIGMPYRNQGRYRDRWLKYMGSDNGIRHGYCVFSRWQPSSEPARDALRPFQRYLRLPDGKPDVDNSVRFAEVLSNTVRWNRTITFVLDQPPHSVFG